MDERDLVYHGLAIKRHAPPQAVADLVGLPEQTVAGLLTQAVATGRAIVAQDAFVLTPLARVALEARYDRHFGGLRVNAEFDAAYQTFERINVTLKQVITDWQTMDVGGQKVGNDHSDADYDARIIDRLGAVHDQVELVLATLARSLPRLAVYNRKLLRALEAAEDGDHAWVSDIRCESYHTVWFELHEDLLRIMGQERSE